MPQRLRALVPYAITRWRERATAARPKIALISRTSLALLVIIAGWSYSIVKYWSADDDHLNFYMTGLALANDKVEHRLGDALSFAKEHDLPISGQESISARKDNLYNYLASSVCYRVAASTLHGLFGQVSEKNYPIFLTYSSLLGNTFSFALAITIFLLVFRQASRNVQVYGLVSLSIILLLQIGVEASGYAEINGPDWWNNIPLALLNPGKVFGALGMTPRNQFILLALAVFMLRCDGRHRASYWLSLLAMLFHRQQGAMLFATMIFADLALRPSVLLDVRLLIAPALGLIYFCSTETFWQRIGLPREAGIAATLGALVLAWALALGWSRLAPKPIGPRSVAANALADMATSTVLWSAATLVALLALRTGIGADKYFWQLLPARLITIIQPWLVFALVANVAMLLPKAISRLTPPKWIVSLTLISFCLYVLAGSVLRLGYVASGFSDRVSRTERLLEFGMTPELTYSDEAALYLSILMAIETSKDPFNKLLEATEHPNPLVEVLRSDLPPLKLYLQDAACSELIQPRRYPLPDSGYQTGALLEAAASWDARDAVELLLARARECNQSIPTQALCLAISYRAQRSAKQLISKMTKAELSSECELGWRTPFCLAVQTNKVDLMRQLLAAGASPQPPHGCGEAGLDPLSFAHQLRNGAAASFLKKSGNLGVAVPGR